MSDQEEITKPSRPEPKLQPMRVVQVPDQPVSQVSTSVEVTPNNPKGKKLVRGKKEIEAELRNKNKPKQAILQTFDTIAQANTKIIEDLDRNAKIGKNDNQASEVDEEWLADFGGKHVSLAWLQTAVSVSGYVSSETTFSPQKVTGLTMSWKDSGLNCKIKNKNNQEIILFIPEANVKCLIFG